MATMNFNAASVEPQQSFDAIPAAWYDVEIDQSEMKPTKAGTGTYLELRLNIITGDFTNRKLFCRLNVENPNAVTVEIAYRQLSSICHAVGVMELTDSQMLHGKPLQAKVALVPPGAGYTDPTNEVKSFRPCKAGAPAAATQEAQPAWAGQPAPAATVAPAQPAATVAPAQPAAAQAQGGQWQAPQAQAAQVQPSTVASAPAAGDTPPWAQ